MCKCGHGMSDDGCEGSGALWKGAQRPHCEVGSLDASKILAIPDSFPLFKCQAEK